jgi:hypothetical protein
MKTKPTKPEAALQSRPEQPGSKTNSSPLAPRPSPLATPPPTAVFFDGPEPEQDRKGEEIPVWHVYVGTEHAEPVSTVYRVFSFTKAQSLAQAMSQDRRLELIAEAQPA